MSVHRSSKSTTNDIDPSIRSKFGMTILRPGMSCHFELSARNAPLQPMQKLAQQRTASLAAMLGNRSSKRLDKVSAPSRIGDCPLYLLSKLNELPRSRVADRGARCVGNSIAAVDGTADSRRGRRRSKRPRRGLRGFERPRRRKDHATPFEMAQRALYVLHSSDRLLFNSATTGRVGLPWLGKIIVGVVTTGYPVTGLPGGFDSLVQALDSHGVTGDERALGG
jgi:hypothetical protein